MYSDICFKGSACFFQSDSHNPHSLHITISLCSGWYFLVKPACIRASQGKKGKQVYRWPAVAKDLNMLLRSPTELLYEGVNVILYIALKRNFEWVTAEFCRYSWSTGKRKGMIRPCIKAVEG